MDQLMKQTRETGSNAKQKTNTKAKRTYPSQQCDTKVYKMNEKSRPRL